MPYHQLSDHERGVRDSTHSGRLDGYTPGIKCDTLSNEYKRLSIARGALVMTTRLALMTQGGPQE